MRLLLDSHVLVWMVADPDKLPPGLADAITDGTNRLFISLASIWELANKVAIGRLPILGTSVPEMIQSFKNLGAEILPISESDVVAASTLPPHHLDPFDRMLIAQAQANSLMIVTTDTDIPKYNVQVLWR